MAYRARRARAVRALCLTIVLVGSLLSACRSSPTPTLAPTATSAPAPTVTPTVSASPTATSAPIPTSPPTPPPTPVPAPTSTPESAELYLYAGELALMRSDFHGADAGYEAAIQVQPGLGPAFSRRAWLYALQLQDRAQASEWAQAGVTLAPDDAESWAYLSLVQVLHGHYDRLPDAATQAVAVDPENALAHVALAQALQHTSQLAQAQAEIDQALELAPDQVLAHIVRAEIQASQGLFDSALSSAEQAVALQPGFAPAQLALAAAHMNLRDYPEAQAALDAVRQSVPDYLPALLQQVQLYAVQGLMDQAEQALARAKTLAPNHPAMWAARGWLDMQQGNPSQASSSLKKAEAGDEAYWPGYLALGRADLGRGACIRAKEDFGRALELLPSSGAAHLGMAQGLLCTGDDEQAEEGYQKAAALAPFDAEVQLGVALHALARGEIETALAGMRTALVQRYDQADFYVSLGELHLNSAQDLDLAAGSFEYALTLAPDNVTALVGLGAVYNQQTDYAQAVETFQQALELDATAPDAHYGLGVAYAMQGAYADAIPHLERAVELETGRADVFLYLGRSYRAQGENEAAGLAMGAFLETGSNAQFQDAIAATADSLVSGEYWLTEPAMLARLDEILGLVATYLAEDLPMRVLSTGVERLDDQRTLRVTLQLEQAQPDEESLVAGTLLNVGSAAVLAPRVRPPLEGGVLIHLQDPNGQEIIEARISLQTAQDLIDGFITDAIQLYQGIGLRDLRRPEARLSGPAALEEIGETVEAERGLSAQAEVTFALMSPEALRAHVEQNYAEESPEEKRADRDLLVLLGLLAPEVDLEQAMIDLDASQIAGYYDTDDKTFYIVSERESGLSVDDELTFAHEYMHALQDQHYDLSVLDDDEVYNDDEQLAYRALVEGEATQVSITYLNQHLTTLEQLSVIMDELQAGSEPAHDAPPILTSLRRFPYLAGLDFVQAVSPGGYWPAVEAVYRDRPASTEQILHPEKYLEERDAPQPVSFPSMLDALKAEWHEMDNDVMGEFLTREYLAGWIAPDLAAVAAAGWDGDRYMLLEHPADGRDLLIWQTVWDTAEDAREFVMAHRAAFEVRPEYTPIARVLRGGDRTLQWCSDVRCVFVRQLGATTWLVYGNQRDDLAMVIPLLEPE